MRKSVVGGSDQVRHKLGCTATQDSQRHKISDLESKGIVLSMWLKQRICVFVFAYAKSWFSQRTILHVHVVCCAYNIHDIEMGRTGAMVSVADYDHGVPGTRPDRGVIRCGIEQVTFTPCLVLVKPRKPGTYD